MTEEEIIEEMARAIETAEVESRTLAYYVRVGLDVFDKETDRVSPLMMRESARSAYEVARKRILEGLREPRRQLNNEEIAMFDRALFASTTIIDEGKLLDAATSPPPKD